MKKTPEGSILKTPADSKEKTQTIEDKVNSLKIQLPEFVQKIYCKKEYGSRVLEINFNPNKFKIKDRDLNAFFAELKKALNTLGLEIGRMTSSGRYDDTFFLNEKIINGKTNWRRWVHFPQNLSAKTTELLDQIAELIPNPDEENNSFPDSYAKYIYFYNSALKQGIITKDERDSINNELYYAANTDTNPRIAAEKSLPK